MVAFAVGHIGATLLVAVGLTAAVELGWLPTVVSRATDVGMSYGAAAVLGLAQRGDPGALAARMDRLVARGRGGGGGCRPGFHRRRTCGGAGARHAGRDAVQSAWALDVGAVLMLAGAAGFGYLVLANTDMLVATAAGLAGAVVGEAVARLRSTREPAAIAPPVTCPT